MVEDIIAMLASLYPDKYISIDIEFHSHVDRFKGIRSPIEQELRAYVTDGPSFKDRSMAGLYKAVLGHLEERSELTVDSLLNKGGL